MKTSSMLARFHTRVPLLLEWTVLFFFGNTAQHAFSLLLLKANSFMLYWGLQKRAGNDSICWFQFFGEFALFCFIMARHGGENSRARLLGFKWRTQGFLFGWDLDSWLLDCGCNNISGCLVDVSPGTTFVFLSWRVAVCAMLLGRFKWYGCNHERVVTCMWVFALPLQQFHKSPFVLVLFLAWSSLCAVNWLLWAGCDWNLDVEVLRCRYVFWDVLPWMIFKHGGVMRCNWNAWLLLTTSNNKDSLDWNEFGYWPCTLTDAATIFKFHFLLPLIIHWSLHMILHHSCGMDFRFRILLLPNYRESDKSFSVSVCASCNPGLVSTTRIFPPNFSEALPLFPLIQGIWPIACYGSLKCRFEGKGDEI